MARLSPQRPAVDRRTFGQKVFLRALNQRSCQMIRSAKTLLSVAVLCTGLYQTAQAATINFTTFTNPHPVMPPADGTVGFTYAGNKFVGSVLQNGTGSLYSTDLTGGNVQPFAPSVSLNSLSGEHYVAASFGL